MKWHQAFSKKHDPDDFSTYLPGGTASTKAKLIAECQRRGVSAYVADSSETSTGPYAALRAVALESELQSRLLQSSAAETAWKANRIAWLALFVGLAGVIVAVAK